VPVILCPDCGVPFEGAEVCDVCLLRALRMPLAVREGLIDRQQSRLAALIYAGTPTVLQG
jgi:hypothetical protein